MKEVKRIAKVGEYIKLVNPQFTFDEVGDILKVDAVNGEMAQVLGKNHLRNTGSNDQLWNYPKNTYVVLENYEEENMSKFKVGDKIKGNEKANKYGITDSNFVGYVIANLRDGGIEVSAVKNDKCNTYCVDEVCFDLFEKTIFTKSDLKNGDILTDRDDLKSVYSEGKIYGETVGIDSLNEDLTYAGSFRENDIVKVERPVKYETIFEREEESVELTINEIKEKFGIKGILKIKEDEE